MAGKIEFLCKLKGGSFFPLYKDAYNQLLKEYDNEDVIISIKRVGKRRTDKFNAYYFAAIVTPIRIAIKEMTGDTYSQEEVHDMLKQRFLSKTVINMMSGEFCEIPMSTATLQQEDFKEYVMKCQKFAADFFNIRTVDLPK